jgi:hypothetical protein
VQPTSCVKRVLSIFGLPYHVIRGLPAAWF